MPTISGGLEQILDSLRETHGLIIHRIHADMSPSKRTRMRLSEEQGYIDKIYSRMHRLYYQEPTVLDRCLKEFHQTAPRGAPHGSQARVHLLQRLFDCLPAKRGSPEMPSVSKRLKTLSGDIDTIPVRSGSSQSSANTSFSSVETPQTSFCSDIKPFAQKLQESMAPGSSPDPDSASTSTLEEPIVIDLTEDVWEHGLDRVWPRDPRGLSDAPLAVLWEVARASQKCDVDFGRLEYEASWHNQASMRATLSKTLPPGQTLPAPSEGTAWQLAIHNDEASNKVPVYVADLKVGEASGPLFKMQLQPLNLDLGNRVARRFGADRLLTINIPQPHNANNLPPSAKDDKKAFEKIVGWLTREPHSFLGRLWTAIFVRDAKRVEKRDMEKQTVYLNQVYMFAIDGNSYRNSLYGELPPPDEAHSITRTKMSRSDFFAWACNWRENQTQQPFKLFSRLALSLSRTHPTIVLERDQIRIQPHDIGTHKIMNDGAGRMSRTLARQIAANLGMSLSSTPCAFQARLGSAKGMWIIDNADPDPDDVWIEIYPSQIKWKCDFADVHHRTFEVKDWPRGLKSASLNQQFIPVLEAQSVDPMVTRQIMAEHLERCVLEDLDPDMAALKDPGEFRLWLQQFQSSDTSTTFLGGLPRRDEDALALLSDSGFQPQDLQLMQQMMLNLKLQKSHELKQRLNITVPCSTYLFMIPDFWGVLEPGQVHVSFSSQFQTADFCDTLLEGIDVIVARAPAHFASDMQKVRAVSLQALRGLKDVIIFSTKGESPLADKLSGGDYDGDRAWVCWDSRIVANFRGSPAPVKPDLYGEGVLKKSKLEFDDLWKRAGDVCAEFVYESFLFNMRQSLLGLCTRDKERYCFVHDTITDPAAVAFSTLLAELVDQAKQGIILTEQSKRAFYNRHMGEHAQRILSVSLPGENQRSMHLVPKNRLHILEYLHGVVERVVEEAGKTLSLTIQSLGEAQQYDSDLTAVWNGFDELNDAEVKRLLALLKRDVDRIKEIWVGTNHNDYKVKVQQVYEQWLAVAPPADLARHWAVTLAGGWSHPQYNTWNLLKASCLFKNTYRWSNMAWFLAGRQLAHIKAIKAGCSPDTADVLVKASMWADLSPDKKTIRKRTAQRNATDAAAAAAAALDEVMEFDEHGSIIDDT